MVTFNPGDPIKKVLSPVLKIQQLTAEDRAELERLMGEADKANEVFGPVMDTPAGMKACIKHLQTVLEQAQAVVLKYHD